MGPQVGTARIKSLTQSTHRIALVAMRGVSVVYQSMYTGMYQSCPFTPAPPTPLQTKHTSAQTNPKHGCTPCMKLHASLTVTHSTSQAKSES